MFEHADHVTPRVAHGYCVDDAARALIVVCGESELTHDLVRMARVYLKFVLAALDPDGRCRNRMDVSGTWTDEPGLGDWWGRALWGLGFAAVHAPTAGLQDRALAGFRVAAQRRSPHSRAMAFAVLGAAELLQRRRPDERGRHARCCGTPLPRSGSARPENLERMGLAGAAAALRQRRGGRGAAAHRHPAARSGCAAARVELPKFLSASGRRDGDARRAFR